MARVIVQLMHFVWQFIQSRGCLTITNLNPVAVTSVKNKTKQQNNKQQDTETFPIPILIPIIVTDDQNLKPDIHKEN